MKKLTALLRWWGVVGFILLFSPVLVIFFSVVFFLKWATKYRT